LDSLFDLCIVGTGVVDQYGRRNTFNGLDQCKRTMVEGFQSVDVCKKQKRQPQQSQRFRRSSLYGGVLNYRQISIGLVSHSITDVLQVFAGFGDPVIPCGLQWDLTSS